MFAFKMPLNWDESSNGFFKEEKLICNICERLFKAHQTFKFSTFALNSNLHNFNCADECLCTLRRVRDLNNLTLFYTFFLLLPGVDKET